MSNIYKPPGSISLDEATYPDQLRVGLQGMPKSGKTFAAAGFPNPIFVSFDRGLTSHLGRKDIIEVPFYDGTFVDTIVKRATPFYTDVFKEVKKITPPNRKDALVMWLSTEALKLTREQTLVIDGSTGIQAAFHAQYWVNPTLDKDGAIKPYEEWRLKIDYFAEIAMCLKALKCNVVYICHEAADRDKKGELNGQIRPLLSGAFCDELQSHFTDWFRCLVIEKPSSEKMEDFKKAFSLTSITAKQWIESTPPEVKCIFVWQTQPDQHAKCGTSMVGAPKIVLADYKTFSQYKRKVVTQ